jgi:hypothetical protein
MADQSSFPIFDSLYTSPSRHKGGVVEGSTATGGKKSGEMSGPRPAVAGCSRFLMQRSSTTDNFPRSADVAQS